MSTSNIFDSFGLKTPFRWNRSRVLLLPFVVFKLLFFVIPLIILLRMSLYPSATNQAYTPGVSVNSYIELITSPLIHDIVIYTFQTAVIVTFLTVLISLPYAYAAWRANRFLKSIMLGATIITLLTTLVVRLYSLNLLLSPTGPVVGLLQLIGYTDVSLTNNQLGVVIGQLYITTPYAVLAIYSVLTSIRTDIFNAALDLGATRPRAFYEVILPNIAPGIVVAVVISFAWTVGAYSSPVLLGSTEQRTFAMQVQKLMVTNFDWPAGAALSVIILAIVMVTLAGFFHFVDDLSTGEGYL